MVLDLVLTYFWYDEILSGRKNIEYREVTPYWITRIMDKRDKIDYVKFRKGYSKTSITKKVDRIHIGSCPYKGWDDKYICIYFSEIKDIEE